jgi:hypothetical protein
MALAGESPWINNRQLEFFMKPNCHLCHTLHKTRGSSTRRSIWPTVRNPLPAIPNGSNSCSNCTTVTRLGFSQRQKVRKAGKISDQVTLAPRLGESSDDYHSKCNRCSTIPALHLAGVSTCGLRIKIGFICSTPAFSRIPQPSGIFVTSQFLLI